MTTLTAYDRLLFIDGLLGYLDVRLWAFEKIRTSPMGSHPADLRMHHYLYFANLFGAVDVVKDHLPLLVEKQTFEAAVQTGFAVPGDYLYARELRNSIVHRGLDPTMLGTQQGSFVRALCPPVVHNLTGKKSHVCSVPLLVDLAAACDKAANNGIYDVLQREGLLDPALHMPDQMETLQTVAATPHMPDWAKAMATKAFATDDFETMAVEIAQSRVERLRFLLGAP